MTGIALPIVFAFIHECMSYISQSTSAVAGYADGTQDSLCDKAVVFGDTTKETLCTVSYLLTPWSRVLLEKLTRSQPVKKFPAFYGNREFITSITSAIICLLSANNLKDGTPWNIFVYRSALVVYWLAHLHRIQKVATTRCGHTVKLLVFLSPDVTICYTDWQGFEQFVQVLRGRAELCIETLLVANKYNLPWFRVYYEGCSESNAFYLFPWKPQ